MKTIIIDRSCFDDGYDDINEIAKQCACYLKDGGKVRLLMEEGCSRLLAEGIIALVSHKYRVSNRPLELCFY